MVERCPELAEAARLVYIGIMDDTRLSFVRTTSARKGSAAPRSGEHRAVWMYASVVFVLAGVFVEAVTDRPTYLAVIFVVCIVAAGLGSLRIVLTDQD